MKKIAVTVIFLTLFAALSFFGCNGDGGASSNNTNISKNNGTESLFDESNVYSENYASPADMFESGDFKQIGKPIITDYANMDKSGWPLKAQKMAENVKRTETYLFTYVSGGCTVAGYISLPENWAEVKRPLLIYNRGGNGDYGANTVESVSRIAYATNCVVIASQYREAYADIEKGEHGGKDEFGGADVDDVVYIIEHAEHMNFIDKQNVIMIGVSRGAMETVLAIRKDSQHIVKAAACVSGSYDLAKTYEQREDMRSMLESRIGGSPSERPDEYALRSAVNFVDEINVPLLILHSTGDEKAAFSQAEAFASLLERAGKKYWLVQREGSEHGVANLGEWADIANVLISGDKRPAGG